jgi:dipeptidyl aminopeptidase/acylaminoacyl peptidase
MTTRAWSSIAALLLLATELTSSCSSPTDTTPLPPADATLAFTMDSSIYLISTTLDARPSLLVADFIQPSWKPQGGFLAAVSTALPRIGGLPPDQAMYLISADGSSATPLTVFDWSIVGRAYWSPDGTSLLFTRVRTFIPTSRWVVQQPTGGGAGRIFSTGFGAPPSWSLDGSLVAVDGIYLINPVSNDTVLHLDGSSPQFSPVNEDLAFRETTTGHIHLIRADGTADRDLQVDGYPETWSGDGTRIGFTGNDGMYIIKPDGSDLTRIGPLSAQVSDIAWSADGGWLAYVAGPAGGPRTLYFALADDSHPRPVVSADALCCLSWQPPTTE